jgi:hypothetical protein
MTHHHHHDHSACIALAWFEAEEWQKLKEVAHDQDKLDATYEKWLAGIERLERQLHEAGQHVHRIYLDVDRLVRWCKARNRPVDSEARTEFAAALAQRASLG